MCDKNKSDHFWHFLLETRSELMLLFPFWFYFEEVATNLMAKLDVIPHLFDKKSVRILIANHMQKMLLDLIKRTLIWEFNLSYKNRKIKLKEFLLSIGCANEINMFFKKYPVINTIFKQLIDNYNLYISEFLERFMRDTADLDKKFSLNGFFLKSFEIEGDAHCSGRRVTVLTLFNPEKRQIKRIVYKPRNINLEDMFYQLLFFLRKIDKKIDLKNVLILSRNQYGWMEFIDQQPVAEDDESKFYYQIGILLCVCYLLNAQDLHYENLIAHGKYPVLVDLECLFSPPITQQQCDNIDYPTITDTLIIPDIGNHPTHYNLSSLLFHANQVSVIDKFTIKGNFENKVYCAREKTYISPSRNILIKKETEEVSDPFTYVDYITQGYKDCAHLILQNKTQFIDFIVNNFSDIENRIIFRPTFLYTKLMLESFHPRLLINFKQYYKHLSQIKKIQKDPVFHAIKKYEIIDLLNGDIPYFSSFTNQVQIKTSKKVIITHACKDSGMKRVIKKISKLSENSINYTSTFILKKMKEAHDTI